MAFPFLYKRCANELQFHAGYYLKFKMPLSITGLDIKSSKLLFLMKLLIRYTIKYN